MVKSHEMIWKLIDLSDANDTPYVPLSIPIAFGNHLLCFLYSKAKKLVENIEWNTRAKTKRFGQVLAVRESLFESTFI